MAKAITTSAADTTVTATSSIMSALRSLATRSVAILEKGKELPISNTVALEKAFDKVITLITKTTKSSAEFEVASSTFDVHSKVTFVTSAGAKLLLTVHLIVDAGYVITEVASGRGDTAVKKTVAVRITKPKDAVEQAVKFAVAQLKKADKQYVAVQKAKAKAKEQKVAERKAAKAAAN